MKSAGPGIPLSRTFSRYLRRELVHAPEHGGGQFFSIGKRAFSFWLKVPGEQKESHHSFAPLVGKAAKFFIVPDFESFKRIRPADAGEKTF